MTKSFKYRSFALVLTALFLAFNIGLPIVVASCPMAGHCTMCTHQSKTPAGNSTSVLNSSCCKTIIAGERNTTEFVKESSVLLAGTFSDIVHQRDFHYSLTSSFLKIHSLPLIASREDIPILKSSLLN